MKTQHFDSTDREEIISSLEKVKHDSIAGYSIRLFAKDAREKPDTAIIECLRGIGKQIVDNPGAMMRVLGNQFFFIKKWAFKL